MTVMQGLPAWLWLAHRVPLCELQKGTASGNTGFGEGSMD